VVIKVQQIDFASGNVHNSGTVSRRTPDNLLFLTATDSPKAARANDNNISKSSFIHDNTLHLSKENLTNQTEIGNMSFQERHYKTQSDILRQKFEKNQKQLSQIKEDRDRYLNELKKLQFTLDYKTTVTPSASKEIHPRRPVQLWHLLMISVVFLILGSLMRS